MKRRADCGSRKPMLMTDDLITNKRRGRRDNNLESWPRGKAARARDTSVGQCSGSTGNRIQTTSAGLWWPSWWESNLAHQPENQNRFRACRKSPKMSRARITRRNKEM